MRTSLNLQTVSFVCFSLRTRTFAWLKVLLRSSGTDGETASQKIGSWKWVSYVPQSQQWTIVTTSETAPNVSPPTNVNGNPYPCSGQNPDNSGDANPNCYNPPGGYHRLAGSDDAPVWRFHNSPAHQLMTQRKRPVIRPNIRAELGPGKRPDMRPELRP